MDGYNYLLVIKYYLYHLNELFKINFRSIFKV